MSAAGNSSFLSTGSRRPSSVGSSRVPQPVRVREGRPLPIEGGGANIAFGPGPGAYTPQKPLGAGGKKFSMKPRWDERPNSPTKTMVSSSPGPGNYDIPSSIGRSLSYSMTGRDGIKTPTSPAPGPGAYSYSQKSVGVDAPKFTLKSRIETSPIKLRSMAESPAPGSYSPAKPLGSDSPAYSLGGRISSPAASNSVPGPGAYSYSQKSVGVDAPKFTLKSRVELGGGSNARSISPGPGGYNAEVYKATGRDSPAFSMSGRFADSKLDNMVPGPGAYAPPSKIGDAQKSTLKGRNFYERKAEPGGGPGAYQIVKPLGSDAPAFGFGTGS